MTLPCYSYSLLPSVKDVWGNTNWKETEVNTELCRWWFRRSMPCVSKNTVPCFLCPHVFSEGTETQGKDATSEGTCSVTAHSAAADPTSTQHSPVGSESVIVSPVYTGRDAFLTTFLCKWWRTPSTFIPLCRNVLKHFSEDNTRLSPST